MWRTSVGSVEVGGPTGVCWCLLVSPLHQLLVLPSGLRPGPADDHITTAGTDY